MKRSIYIHEFAVACPLGENADAVRKNLLSGTPSTISGRAPLIGGRMVPVGLVPGSLAPYAGDTPDSRCNMIADHCLGALAPAIAAHIDAVGHDRVAIVLGTCTSGVGECGQALAYRSENGRWPDGFRYSAQELGDTAAHIAKRTGARGPCYGISTACTSGAKALASAARLIEAGLCDIAIAGGIDSICGLTLNGFASLESVSDRVANPFSRNRRGINLGEGGAVFILSAAPSAIRLASWGESADAYHISAPDPEGVGAEMAMRLALQGAAIEPADIAYLNLHGTATKLNDIMEAKAVARVFGLALPCSSTKPLTGHMLGAAGACEAAFTIMALQEKRLPRHQWDGERDAEMPEIRLVASEADSCAGRIGMSCSYAFGGNNIALALEVA